MDSLGNSFAKGWFLFEIKTLAERGATLGPVDVGGTKSRSLHPFCLNPMISLGYEKTILRLDGLPG